MIGSSADRGEAPVMEMAQAMKIGEAALLAWRPVGILLFSVAEPESSKFGTGTAINSCGFFCDVMADHAHNN
jgi:hypothetical protein